MINIDTRWGGKHRNSKQNKNISPEVSNSTRGNKTTVTKGCPVASRSRALSQPRNIHNAHKSCFLDLKISHSRWHNLLHSLLTNPISNHTNSGMISQTTSAYSVYSVAQKNQNNKKKCIIIATISKVCWPTYNTQLTHPANKQYRYLSHSISHSNVLQDPFPITITQVNKTAP